MGVHVRRGQPGDEPPFDPLEEETDLERTARVDELRQEYLSGKLDLTVNPQHEGVDRLLQDLFAQRRPKRTRR